MKALLDSPFTYFSVPFLVSSGCLWIFYHTPSEIAEGVIILTIPILFLPALSRLLGYRRLGVISSTSKLSIRASDKLVIYFVSILIVALSPIDIMENGFKIANPSTYAEFTSAGRYVRHITSLCWILVPVAFFLVRNRLLRRALILYAVIFPILIVDRNRLLLVFFVIAFSFIATTEQKNSSRTILIGMFFTLALFAMIGIFRSGDSFLIESSGRRIVDNYLPLRDLFFSLPALLQQIILYITTPIFNFATVYSESFINQDFLLSQLSPFGRDQFDTYPYSPILVPRFNVGTEFFPLLTFDGIGLVYLSLIIMYLSFLCAAQFLIFSPNIFSLLIFLKVAHTVVFMGFAPQFFILLNFAFIVVILILYLLSSILNSIRTKSS